MEYQGLLANHKALKQERDLHFAMFKEIEDRREKALERVNLARKHLQESQMVVRILRDGEEADLNRPSVLGFLEWDAEADRLRMKQSASSVPSNPN